jgi:hypothetical protein
MIYRALIDHMATSLADLNCQNNVEASCVVNRSPVMHSVDDDMTLSRIAVKDHTDVVIGMIPIEDMSLYARDRKDLGQVRQYTLKLVDNIYLYASAAYKHRKMMNSVMKWSNRRKMMPKLKRLLPVYAKNIEKYDRETMKKLNIPVEEVATHV